VNHQAILFSTAHGQKIVWPFADRDPVPVTGRLRVNSYEQVFQAALAGAGIARMPMFLCKSALSDGRLLPVLTAYKSQPLQLHVLYPSRRQLSRKVSAFVELLLVA